MSSQRRSQRRSHMSSQMSSYMREELIPYVHCVSDDVNLSLALDCGILKFDDDVFKRRIKHDGTIDKFNSRWNTIRYTCARTVIAHERVIIQNVLYTCIIRYKLSIIDGEVQSRVFSREVAIRNKNKRLTYKNNIKITCRPVVNKFSKFSEISDVITGKPNSILYHPNGVRKFEAWLYKSIIGVSNSYARTYDMRGRLIQEMYRSRLKKHRDNHPSIITYYENGKVKEEAWYYLGKLHRDFGPAIEQYYSTGQLKARLWYHNGVPHNRHGPAILRFDEHGKIIDLRYMTKEV